MAYNLARIVAQNRRTRSKAARRVFAWDGVEFTPAEERTLFLILMKVVRAWDAEGRKPAAADRLPALEIVADSTDDLERAMEEAEGFTGRLLLTLTPELRSWVLKLDRSHAARFVRRVKNATGVDLDTLIGLAPNQQTMAAVLNRLVGLIRSIDDDTRRAVGDAVWRGFTTRSPRYKIAQDIRAVMEATRRRAMFIARDQTTKLAAVLDRERQEEAGIRRYRWRHSRKAKPRLHHVAREGKIYAWTRPPYDGHPGTQPNCGCKAQAYLNLDTDL